VRAVLLALCVLAPLALWLLALAVASSVLSAPVLAQARATLRATMASVAQEARMLQLEKEELHRLLAPLALAHDDPADDDGRWAGVVAAGRVTREVQSTAAFKQLGVLALVQHPDPRSWGALWLGIAAQTVAERTSSTVRALAGGARSVLAFSAAAARHTSASARFVNERTLSPLRQMMNRSRELRQVQRAARRMRRAPSAPQAHSEPQGPSLASELASQLYRRGG
jgi:hypothetical protein